jgi:two-component system chemotaxis sensor kinase CheA
MDDLLSEFIEEATETILSLDNQLLELEKDPNNKDIIKSIFRLLHTIKGTCGFIGLSRLEKVAHAGEAVLVHLRDGKIFADAAIVTLILECVDAVKFILQSVGESGNEPEGNDDLLVVRLNEAINNKNIESRQPDAATVSEHGPESLDNDDSFFTMDFEDTETSSLFHSEQNHEVEKNHLGSDAIGEEKEIPNFFDASVTDDEIFDFYVKKAKEDAQTIKEDAQAITELENKQISDSNFWEEESNSSSVEIQKETPIQKKTESSSTTIVASNIRVNIKLLENLMSQVSELVLTRNQILEIFKEFDSKEISMCLHRLDQITSELRDEIAKTRMQPISNAWTILPRLARELAIDTGKKVDLIMLGGETEIDKQVIELIKDPLMHMLRNSIDHGLESPEERVLNGKLETGTITLNAYHEGGIIVIEVSDDGKGLPIEKIKEKAIANGLTTPQFISSLTDSQIYQFILRSGFSTAESVTHISGRGVGMDVVRANIVKINGTIDVKSYPGKGASFTIKIPLTLAIISALLIESWGFNFAVPQLNVQELIKLSEEEKKCIEYISNKPLLRLRDELIPLVSLETLLQTNEEFSLFENKNASTHVVILQTSSGRIGVIVDKILEMQEIVVKPVSSLLRHLTVYSGNTILGDGRIAMILDPNEIANLMSTSFIHDEIYNLNLSIKEIEKKEENEVFMLLRTEADADPIAIPLFEIERVETIDMSRIESFDAHPLVQYHEALIPLMILVKPSCSSDDTNKPFLILTRENQTIGLVVYSIGDIFENEENVSIDLNLPGKKGVVVLNGIATDVIDTSYYFKEALSLFGSQQSKSALNLNGVNCDDR